MHLLNKNIALFLLSLLLVSTLNGQVNYRDALNAYQDQALIKALAIKSLVIYAEFNERSIERSGGYAGKLAEFEFNDMGCQIYKLTSNNRGNLPFVEYGRGSIIAVNTYNEQCQLLSNYIETYNRIWQDINTYDSKGRKTSFIHTEGEDTLIWFDFEWKGGKMVEAKLTQANENNRKRINRFDEQGRIIESTSQYWSDHYQYNENNDTLTTTIFTYRADTLYNSQYYSTVLKFNQINHYIKKDHSGKVIIEMKANFDAYGNATAYYINDLTNKYHGNKHYPPTSYRIENTYNQNKLLAKRMYYYSREDVGKNLLTKIEKYCYDKAPLPFKMKMGLIREREVMEEMIDH